jgi:predicted Zn-dependent protease
MRNIIIPLLCIALLQACNAPVNHQRLPPQTGKTVQAPVADAELAALLAESRALTTSPAMLKFIAEAEAQPDNPEHLYNLGYNHMQLGVNNHDARDLKLAAGYLNRVLALVPGNQSVLNALYNVYYDDTFNNRYLAAYDKARDTWLQLTESTRLTMNPPSLARYVAQLIWQEKNHQPNRQELRETLLRAIQENPNNDKAYIQLAKIYSDDHYFALALATLKLGAENISNSADLYKTLAITYEQRAESTNCNYEHPGDIANSIKYFKLAVPLKPEDAQLHYNLAYAFFDQNLQQLGLNESGLAMELGKQAGDLALNAQHYSMLGMHDKANKLLNAALSQGYSTAESGVHEIYMNQGDWKNAANSFNNYLKAQTSYTVYDLIKSDMIANQTQQRPAIINQKISLGSDWEEALFNYWSAKISSEDLKKRAHNACEKTEYYFYTGYRDLMAGQQAQAKTKFTAALNQNTYRFIERPLARLFLQQ